MHKLYLPIYSCRSRYEQVCVADKAYTRSLLYTSRITWAKFLTVVLPSMFCVYSVIGTEDLKLYGIHSVSLLNPFYRMT